MGQLAEDHEALVGRTIAGKFAIESYLGGGAMGSVYRARQTALDKLVAIKVLHRDLGSDPAFTARFQREAKAASRLDHPNSVRVLDYGEEDGLCYIAMELLDGRTLFKVIHSDGLLAVPRVIELLRQTLAALAVAHDMGVVHRDLKPENIVVLESPDDEGGMKEVVKVCDFGIAKIIGTRAEVSPASSEKLTGQGSVLGTPEYMSPEQSRGEPLGPASDLYSMGVILYELLTGKTPFEAETALGILLKHIVEEPVPPSELRPDVDRHLEAICLKAMRKKPEERYKTAREMRHALISVLEAHVPMNSTSPMPLTRPVTAGNPFPSAPTPTPTLETSAPAQTAPSLPALKVAEPDSLPMSRPRAAEQLLSLPPPANRQMRNVILGSLAVGAVIAVAVMLTRSHPQVVSTVASLPPEAPAPSASSSAAALFPVQTEQTPPSLAVLPSPTLVAPPSVHAAASASAKAAASATHVPTAAAPSAVPSSIPSAPSASASAIAAAPGPFDGAKVQIGAVKAEHASAADVSSALPITRFNQCYRDGLRTRGTPTGGPGMLHLVLDKDGVVTEASFAGSEALAPIGQCIVNSSTGRKIKTTEPTATSADIDLAFKPE